ncbi:MAG TPA: type II secretion system F family protein [Candidatus Baltobacteraceae bacterium]|jgi:type II secretory pathway component PulF|nr:type II secretion system F family protein [Candidatus Baltobacteraceae bacterium]
MPVFTYKAFQADGKTAEGQIEAGGRQEAFRQMEEKGLRPITLAEKSVAGPGKNGASAAPTAGKFTFQSRKVTPRMLENFTRLLSSLLAAGVPLSRALVILCKEASNPTASAKWKQIYDSVIDGVTLADSMATMPETFPRVYVAMVSAGETGGFLDLVLAQIADFQAREKDLKSKVTAALLYPAILFVLAIGVMIVLMTFFIPRFQKMFEGFGGTMPLLTRIIVYISHLVRAYGLYVGIGVVIVGYLIRNWISSEEGRRSWEGLVLRVPVLGPLLSQFAMARFCRMLGTLLNAGVPLVQALNVARKSIGNQILVDAVSNSIDRVKEGAQLGASLSDCRNLFPSSVLEMISVAEESGKLDQELVRIAGVTEGDLDRNLKTSVAFLEPLMLFFIAAFVGLIFIGMLLPIFSMQDYIK